MNLEKKYKDAVKQKMDMDFWDTSLFDKAQQRIHHILSSDCVMVFAERCLGMFIHLCPVCPARPARPARPACPAWHVSASPASCILRVEPVSA